ncbi:MAG: methyltransferase [Rhodospirillales bacterium]|nr:methyltransferase [Rhodospirillales bacterium]MDH3917108.1 methyltransferase [Rhodospirillales bacterium]
MRRKPRRGGGRQAEVTIESLGGRGDGVGRLDGRPVFVPLTLPGDRVRLRVTGEKAGAFKAEVIELLAGGPGRVEPPCPHYGPCGGCALQHLEAGRTASWKREQVVQALARRGLPGEAVRPLIVVPPGSRRRAALAAVRTQARVLLGFHERASHKVVDAPGCLLLTPGLTAVLPLLRAALAGILAPRESADVTLSETESGVDLLLISRRPPDLAAREALAELARNADLARLSWASPDGEPEPIVRRRPPRISFAGVAVEPPPGGFLQPSAEGGTALTRLVLGGLPEAAERVLDLYAGCGAFSFPLAEHARVHAVEGDEAALAALRTAARQAGLEGRVSAEARDLARRPLDASELAGFDCAVFDPPRAGARAQTEAFAASDLPAVVAVSCNPNTFARDARILVDGGFALGEVTPLDQFPWSGHVELVAGFKR